MRALVAFCAAGLVSAATASADIVKTLTFSGSNANSQSGTAQFYLNATTSTVRITLTNTMSVLNGNAYDLAALYWTFTNSAGPNPTLDLNSNASYTSGTPAGIYHNDGYSVGQLWAFHDPSNSWSAPGSAVQGLSAAGLGLFDGGDMLASGGPGNSPDGPDGTIIYDAAHHHSSGQHPQQFLSNIVFEFHVTNSHFFDNFNTLGVSAARLQFNTGNTASEQVGLSQSVVPLPPAAWAGLASLSGVMGMFYVRRRSLKN